MTAGLRLDAWTGERDIADPLHAELATRTIATLTERSRPAPWGCYLARGAGAIVGIGAFKGAPDAEGTVEIAYLTLPPFQRRGHATAMIAALVAIADAGGAHCVIAHTRPAVGASARALLRNGFVQADAFHDPDDGPVWYWERVLAHVAA